MQMRVEVTEGRQGCDSHITKVETTIAAGAVFSQRRRLAALTSTSLKLTTCPERYPLRYLHWAMNPLPTAF